MKNFKLKHNQYHFICHSNLDGSGFLFTVMPPPQISLMRGTYNQIYLKSDCQSLDLSVLMAGETWDHYDFIMNKVEKYGRENVVKCEVIHCIGNALNHLKNKIVYLPQSSLKNLSKLELSELTSSLTYKSPSKYEIDELHEAIYHKMKITRPGYLKEDDEIIKRHLDENN